MSALRGPATATRPVAVGSTGERGARAAIAAAVVGMIAVATPGCGDRAGDRARAGDVGNAGEPSGDAGPAQRRGKDDAPVAPPVAQVFATRTGPPPRAARIFLFAGSSQNANFAHEVIEQRKLWLATGFSERDIACYYVVPYQEELEGDRAQWLALAPALASCYPASAGLLHAHLAAVADADGDTDGARPPFVYVYLTAHGERPVSLALADREPGDDGYHSLVRKSRYPALDHYRVIVEALADGTAGDGEILGAYRAGIEPRALWITPGSLAEALAGYADIPKFVVIQACFSGGFIRDPRRPDAAQPLRALPRITIMTAARHDRESFGCNAGEQATFYGGAYLEALREQVADPRAPERVADPRTINWQALHRATRARVEALEREAQERPSLPALYTSADADPAVR